MGSVNGGVLVGMAVKPAGVAAAGWRTSALTPRRAMLLLVLLLVLLGAVTPWSLIVSVPIVLRTLLPVRHWNGLALGAALLLGGSVLSLFVSIDLPVSLTTLAGIFGAFAVAVLLLQWWQSPQRLGSGIGVYVGIACVLVLLATIQVDIQFAKLNAMSQAVYGWFGRWRSSNCSGVSGWKAAMAPPGKTWPRSHWTSGTPPRQRCTWRALGTKGSTTLSCYVTTIGSAALPSPRPALPCASPAELRPDRSKRIATPAIASNKAICTTVPWT